MQKKDIRTSGPVTGIPSCDVEAAQAKLGLRFPSGYFDFITSFGEGALSDIRIYPPARILGGINGLSEWRERIAEYWFWDEPPILLTQEKALECVILGDTFDGDELIFHPSDPDRIYFLPRHSEKVFFTEGGLYPAIIWYCTSGILIQPYQEHIFEPFDSNAV